MASEFQIVAFKGDDCELPWWYVGKVILEKALKNTISMLVVLETKRN